MIRPTLCALTLSLWMALLATPARAGVAIDFNIQFDSSIESRDYLSDFCIFYYADVPGDPYTFIYAVSYLIPEYASIPVNNPDFFHFRIEDLVVSDPGNLVNYGVMGTYNDVDTGAGPSFFCSFFDATVTEGKTFDDVFAGPDWNAIEGPYTEEQVLAALTDPLGIADPQNGLLISYMMAFTLFDATGIATPFTNPGVEPQSNTLFHFSTATPFATGSATTSIVPEPTTGVLTLLALAGLGLTCLGSRVRHAS